MIDFTIGPKIDLDGNNSCRIVSWPDGSCRPAHETEIALWAENEALHAELEAVKAELATALDDAKHAEESQTAVEKRGREYYDRMLTAEARAAQLGAENGRLREELRERNIQFCNAFDDGFTAGESHGKALAEAELARLKDRVAGLERTLLPFSKEADAWDGFDDTESLTEEWNGGPATNLHVSDLRAARAILTTDNPGGDTAREATHD